MLTNGGFILGGKTANELGIFMARESARPILPDTVDSIATIAGRHGAFDFGATLSPKRFELTCACSQTNSVTLQGVLRSLAAFLLDSNGRPRTMQLTLDIDTTRTYYVRWSGSLPVDRNSGTATFILPLVAYDPFAYGSEIRSNFVITGTNTYMVNNIGSIEAHPMIEVTGSFTTLSIKVGSRTLVYNESKSSAGTLVIDCNKMSAKLGATNKNNKVSGDWLKLATGTNNVEINGTGLNCTVSFFIKPKYL